MASNLQAMFFKAIHLFIFLCIKKHANLYKTNKVYKFNISFLFFFSKIII